MAPMTVTVAVPTTVVVASASVTMTTPMVAAVVLHLLNQTAFLCDVSAGHGCGVSGC